MEVQRPMGGSRLAALLMAGAAVLGAEPLAARDRIDATVAMPGDASPAARTLSTDPLRRAAQARLIEDLADQAALRRAIDAAALGGGAVTPPAAVFVTPSHRPGPRLR